MEVMLIDHFNIEKGISIFGEKAETAVMEELQKIHDMNIYKQMDASTLAQQERKYTLASILFTPEKRNREIKARYLFL